MTSLETILSYFTRTTIVTRKGKLNRAQIQNNKVKVIKNQEGNSNTRAQDEEDRFVKRKLEAEKARKRTRGPYRKSHVN
jgi:hypothetical protein